MKKNLVLMAKSKKGKDGYCIAAIDAHSGEWVRLNMPGNYSIPRDSFKYNDGEEPELLEVFSIEITGKDNRDRVQPENYFCKIGTIERLKNDCRDVVRTRIRMDSRREKIFYDDKSFLETEWLNRYSGETYSLVIIEPENLRFRRKSETTIVASFKYNGVGYSEIRVTDMDFAERCRNNKINQQFYATKDYVLVMSLGEPFVNIYTGREENWKLIAAVIDKTKLSKITDPTIFIDPIIEDPGDKDTLSEDVDIDFIVEQTSVQTFDSNLLLKMLQTVIDGVDRDSGETIDTEAIISSRDFRSAIRAINRKINSGKQKSTRREAASFPYYVLSEFEYQEDKPVSHVLRQFVELTADPNTSIISAAKVNKWLGDNGYLTRIVIDDNGKENWTPTEKGVSLGLIAEKCGELGSEYIRIEYNKNAQEFLANNLQRITEESLNEGNYSDDNSSTSNVDLAAASTDCSGSDSSSETEADGNLSEYAAIVKGLYEHSSEHQPSESNKKSCDNCKLYRNNSCGGINGPCNNYEYAPTYTDEEKEQLPTWDDVRRSRWSEVKHRKL